MDDKQLMIRNSTAEFLIFQADAQAQGVEVLYKDETIWCTKKAMAELYGIDRSGISRHISNIYKEGELPVDTTCAKNAQLAQKGFRGNVSTDLDYYNLDVTGWSTQYLTQQNVWHSDIYRRQWKTGLRE